MGRDSRIAEVAVAQQQPQGPESADAQLVDGPRRENRARPRISPKYLTLARDCLLGDPVLAENYLQHAEHYNRIIMAFREQQMQQGGDVANGGMRQRPTSSFDPLDGGDEFGEDEGDDFGPEQGSEPYTGGRRSRATRASIASRAVRRGNATSSTPSRASGSLRAARRRRPRQLWWRRAGAAGAAGATAVRSRSSRRVKRVSSLGPGTRAGRANNAGATASYDRTSSPSSCAARCAGRGARSRSGRRRARGGGSRDHHRGYEPRMRGPAPSRIGSVSVFFFLARPRSEAKLASSRAAHLSLDTQQFDGRRGRIQSCLRPPTTGVPPTMSKIASGLKAESLSQRRVGVGPRIPSSRAAD